jgi:hypothetical protein
VNLVGVTLLGHGTDGSPACHAATKHASRVGHAARAVAGYAAKLLNSNRKPKD